MYPIPNAMPAPIAISIAAISSALPCALRKRIRANAPPIATPAPILPATKVITDATTKGISVTTMKKRFAERMRKLITHEYTNPETSAAAAMIKNCDGVTTEE